MIKEALQYLVNLGQAETIQLNGRVYSTKGELKLVKNPTPEPLNFHTLDGLLEFSKTFSQPDQDLMLHVAGFDCVKLVDMATDENEQRHVFGMASTSDYLENFPYGQFLTAEDFVIKLQTFFLDTDDKARLASLVGNMTMQNSVDVSDDGITQTVALKAGVVLKTKGELPPIVNLQPFRTFHEVVQPESSFLLRIRKGRDGDLPQVALFESDGRAWILEAIKNVSEYLKLKSTIKVIA